MTQKQNEVGATRHTPAPWVYILSEKACADNNYHTLWTVGFYAPDGKWRTDSDHQNREDAAYRTAFLNGDIVKLHSDAVNSYAKHCKDPIAAAEGDLLGQMREALEDLASQFADYRRATEYGKRPSNELINMSSARIAKAHAILAQTKEV